ncbi:MAG: aminodeoxychorismate/anthranilate synthase component II [Bacteroidales bacterium]|nr:aminodeoxychorismate/anthranilate synthase component II [Bacteroidales bacterium]
MKVLLLDNYDSFTHNLKQLIVQFGVQKLDIIKNDKIDLDTIKHYDKIMLSPGPGLPSEAGLMMEIIDRYASSKPILGVCLGHHAIAEYFGAKLFNLNQPVHGIARKTNVLKTDSIFRSIDDHFQVGLYHSWAVSDGDFPTDLEIVARSEMGIIMAIRHRKYNIKGVQFHPESILTPKGKTMIWNWLSEAIV